MLKNLTLAAAMALAAPAIAMLPAEAQTQTAPAQQLDAQSFVEQAGANNLFEIRSSEIMLEGQPSEEVVGFSQRMIEDHRAAGERLREAAPEGATVPEELPDRFAGMIERLEGASGEERESAYLEMQVMAHEEAVALFERYAGEGEDEDLRAFAEETLPALRAHLDEARRLAGEST